MIRRPAVVLATILPLVLFLAACGGGSSKSAASSDSTSSSSSSKSTSSSSSNTGASGGATAADVKDKSSFCKAAKDISDGNNEITGAVLTILSASDSNASFPSDAEKQVQTLGPRLSGDYDAMVKASSGSLNDDIVTLRDFTNGLFQPIVDASSREEFSSAIDALTSAGRSSDAKAAASATQRIDAVTFSECNVHTAANQ